MPTVTLPDEPTPEILIAIKAAMFAPLTGTASVNDRLRERVIYRAVLRATAVAKTKTIWKIEGSGREAEPTSHAVRVDAEANIGAAVTALQADGFPDVSITAEQASA